MAKAFLCLGLALCVVAVQDVGGRARIGYLWTFDELTSKADCVVIAEHVRTIDTGRRTAHPVLTPGYPVIEWETALTLLAVLKPCGQAKASAGMVVRLKHYTPDRERIDAD